MWLGEGTTGVLRTAAGGSGDCTGAAARWRASNLASTATTRPAATRSPRSSGRPSAWLNTSTAVASLPGAPNARSKAAWARADSYPAGSWAASADDGDGWPSTELTPNSPATTSSHPNATIPGWAVTPRPSHANQPRSGPRPPPERPPEVPGPAPAPRPAAVTVPYLSVRSSTVRIAVVLSDGAVTPRDRYPTKIARTRTG